MDCFFKFSKRIFKGRGGKLHNTIARHEDETPKYVGGVPWSELHISIVREYLQNISRTRDLGREHGTFLLEFIAPVQAESTRSSLLFQFIRCGIMVPRLNNFHQSQNHRIKEYQLVEVFIGFLLRLLYRKTDLGRITPREDRTNSLEKELIFLHTILGDISWMLCENTEHEEFQNLLAEFEAAANEAATVVHSLFFSIDRVSIKKFDEGLDVFLKHIDLFKANFRTFLNFLSSISISSTPKTSAVDSFLIVDSLIHDLEDLVTDDNLTADVKDQIKTLHQGLTILQSSIKDVRSPQPSEIAELKEPLMRIGDMAHQAEYLIVSFLFGCIPPWYLINRLTDVNHKIQLIGTDVLGIIKKYKTGGLIVAKYFSAQLPLQAKRNLEVDNAAVGFEDKVIHMLDQLEGGTERLHVISIFGMPGLGKTTLAKKLYNHSSVKYRFDKLSWCVVSQTYLRRSTMADILIHIASELGKDRILKMEEESLVEHIYKTLKGRRYLIVMDDIWDSNVWDDLQRCFPDDGNGSRILFTTRNKDVAPRNSTIYAQPSLSNDQCWELLEKKVFGNKLCPPELVWIGKKIAANCHGLPLAVVVIAGVLSTMGKEKSTWEKVEGNLTSYIFDDGDDTMMQILELSYKHLPEHLKPCFLYLGVFSEDEEIPAGNLTRLWIAEGFIHKEVGKSPENVAEKYLAELIDKSLVIITKRRSDGGVKTCTIHDLLRDLCLKKSNEENFLKFEDNGYSIYQKADRLIAKSASFSFCQYVRSVHFIHMVPQTFSFRELRLLRVLHCNCLNTHLRGIEYLVYLRYLVVTDLPVSVGSLVNLEYLLVNTHKTVYLPQAVLEMKKLRYIHVGSQAVYGRDCTNSSRTNRLEFLYGVLILNLKDEEMLRCSPHLRKLKLWADRDVDLSFLTLLESLKIGANYVEIDKIRFPSNIRKLTLSVSRLSGEKMSIIGRLENLEVLKLKSCSFEVDKKWDTSDGEFQKLTLLKLDQIKNLTQWNVASSQHFPLLRRLVLRYCYDLEEIPCEIGEVPALQLIEVGRQCPKSLIESAKRIQQEQWDMGNEELEVNVTATDYTSAW